MNDAKEAALAVDDSIGGRDAAMLINHDLT